MLSDSEINANFIIRFFPNEKGIARSNRPDTLLTGRTLRLVLGEELSTRIVNKVVNKGDDRTVINLRKKGKIIFISK